MKYKCTKYKKQPSRLTLSYAILTSFQVGLGMAVQRACESQAEPLKFLYPLESSIKEKIESIAKFYGASGVEYSEQVIP
jgi:formyltetrahydrofolate synthetase